MLNGMGVLWFLCDICNGLWHLWIVYDYEMCKKCFLVLWGWKRNVRFWQLCLPADHSMCSALWTARNSESIFTSTTWKWNREFRPKSPTGPGRSLATNQLLLRRRQHRKLHRVYWISQLGQGKCYTLQQWESGGIQAKERFRWQGARPWGAAYLVFSWAKIIWDPQRPGLCRKLMMPSFVWPWQCQMRRWYMATVMACVAVDFFE